MIGKLGAEGPDNGTEGDANDSPIVTLSAD